MLPFAVTETPTSLVVIDASAVLALLLNRREAERLRERLARGNSLHAPHLIDLEVTQVLRRAVRQGALTAEAAAERLSDFSALRLERYAHTRLLERIWDLRDVLSAYDAAYVTLAEVLDAPLITLDGRLSRTAGHRASIEFFGEA